VSGVVANLSEDANYLTENMAPATITFMEDRKAPALRSFSVKTEVKDKMLRTIKVPFLGNIGPFLGLKDLNSFTGTLINVSDPGTIEAVITDAKKLTAGRFYSSAAY
jgi:hypothetical protein